MATVMGVLLIASIFSAAALAAAQGDIPLTGGDDDRKASYSAAEAGAAYYTQQLDRDRDYWRLCVPLSQPGEPKSPVNQPWNGSSPDPREWRSLPDGDPPTQGPRAQYTIELLPANGAQCVPGNDASMIDASTGMLRIRATGRSGPNDKRPRSIVVTYRRASLLDFIYFTDYETQDPLLPGGSPACATYHHAGPRPSSCEIRFVTGDRVNGPLHSNDDLAICGSPVFGRTAKDKIETPGYWAPSCTANPTFVGELETQSPPLTLPSSDAELAAKALPEYTFTGRTDIVLNGNSMRVTNAGTTRDLVIPPRDGLIYVTENTACTTAYQPSNPYNRPAGCAEAYVRGSSSRDLTVASKRDVVVNGNVTRSGDVVIGLVAEQFVRVYHKHRDCGDTATDYLQNVSIDAAILSLKHSFIVDNFDCGPRLGTLTVNGAIAQAHRGPVGTGPSSGDPTTGYLKNYTYDDRLRGRSPPFFLDPVASAWKVIRYNEQVPTR